MPSWSGSALKKRGILPVANHYDQEFNLIGERTLDPLAPCSHFANFVWELFEDESVIAQAQEMEGLLTLQSDQSLVAVTLRQNDAPSRNFPEEVPTLTSISGNSRTAGPVIVPSSRNLFWKKAGRQRSTSVKKS